MSSTNNSPVIKHIVSGAIGFKERYVPDYSNLTAVVKTLKDAGYKIVLTQGVYDLFHVGHKRYLEEAKSHGDILIVGVDTDELTRKRKGPNRPFDKLKDRVEILSGLKSVDVLTVRNDNDHQYKLIKLIGPDVLIMSETTRDFNEEDRKNLLKYCGEVKVLPAKAAMTTTAKLRRLMTGGVEQLGDKIKMVINEFLSGIDNESGNSVHTSNSQGASGVLPKGKAGRPLRSRKESHK